MKILCIAYRDWALEIYTVLDKSFQDHEFIIINSKKSYLKFNIYDYNPDLILWYGWSDIIDKKIIKEYYSVMLHPSSLPKYRGGSPIQNQIIKLLIKLQKKYDLSYIFISHDIRVIRSVSDYIIVLKKGEIIEEGSADEIFNTPKNNYTKELLSASIY